jgi:hypothetical protein
MAGHAPLPHCVAAARSASELTIYVFVSPLRAANEQPVGIGKPWAATGVGVPSQGVSSVCLSQLKFIVTILRLDKAKRRRAFMNERVEGTGDVDYSQEPAKLSIVARGEKPYLTQVFENLLVFERLPHLR